MAFSPVCCLKSVFSVLGCLMVATLVYTLVTDGSPFRKELLTPWMNTTLVDFYINVAALTVWVFYKESNWVSAVLWVILLVGFGRDTVGQKRKFSPVLTARVFFSILGCLMAGLLVYTLCTDGSPFRKELLTPWMLALLIDFYINVVALSVWVAYKESNWMSTLFWIVLLICFGSITTSVYIVQHLLQLFLEDPLYFVLLKCGTRYERTLS